MTVPPDAARAALIDGLIIALKTAGVWARLDAFYMLAAHDEQAACRNWVADAFNLVPIANPAFQTDRGYTGNGSTSYLESGYDPTIHATHFLRDDHHMAVGIGTNVAEDKSDIGNTRNRIFSRTLGNSISGRSASDIAPMGLPPATDARGRICVTRPSSSSFSIYKNGTHLSTNNQTTLPLTVAGFRLLGSGGLITSSTKQHYHGSWGASLSQVQIAAYDLAARTYLRAVNVIV